MGMKTYDVYIDGEYMTRIHAEDESSGDTIVHQMYPGMTDDTDYEIIEREGVYYEIY